MDEQSGPRAPRAIGPYTPVVRAGDWIIVSGQVGVADGVLADGIEAQTRQAIENVRSQLASMGVGLDAVRKTLCFLADMTEFSRFNDAYVAAFGDGRPARSTVGVVALPMGAAVEIEAWAFQSA